MKRAMFVLGAAALVASVLGTGPSASADEQELIHRDVTSEAGCKPFDGWCVYTLEGTQIGDYYHVSLRDDRGPIIDRTDIFTGQFALPSVTLSGPGFYRPESVTTIDVRYTFDSGMIVCAAHLFGKCVAYYPFDPTRPVPQVPHCGSPLDTRKFFDCVGDWFGHLPMPVGGQLVFTLSRTEGGRTTIDQQVRLPLVGQILAVLGQQ
jgi:hypothetical protein